jgi:hypothetical protein
MEQRLRRAVFDRLELLSEEASNAEPGELVTLARDELRRLTAGWRELLASHQPDEDGRCPRCSGWLRRRRWPCPVWLTAHYHLIGEGLWQRHQRVNRQPSPFSRRNPTIVIPRQLPARCGPTTIDGGAYVGVHRAAIEGAPRLRPSYRNAS